MNLIDKLGNLDGHFFDCLKKHIYTNIDKSNFTFKDLNAQVLDTTMATLCGGKGILDGLNFRYVIYHPSHLAVYPTGGLDIISFGFQGCYMALFDYEGNRYGAHIAKDSGNYKGKDYSNNSVHLWNHLVEKKIIQCVAMFDPTEAIPYCFKKHWGIITSDGSCFAVIIDEKESYFLVQNMTPLKGEQAIIPIS